MKKFTRQANVNYILIAFILLVGTVGHATNYYSDPSASGNMTNNGSFAAPWASLSSIFSANKTFAAGDTIFLRTGNHGYAIIKGLNTGFVVIMPQPGQDPVISRIRISSTANTPASYWKLYQLTVQSEATGTMAVASYTLLEIYPFATHITISQCTITSNLNTKGWTRDDWRNRCNNGISTRGRLNADYIIENNLIKNTAFGLTISSSNTIVRGNTVENFTNDGSRVLGSYILFEKNRVTDLIKVMTNVENHDDLFQSFVYPSGGTGQDTLKNDTIRNNIFICCTDTLRAFRGPAQGIGCFDGVFLRWIVENNIVLTDHWHGISMYGAVDCKIVNNTVLDPYKYTPVDPFDNNSTNIGPTWITINKKTNGPNSSGNLVKNNLMANTIIILNPAMAVVTNNLIVGALGNYSNYFTDVADFAQPGNFDLHLKPGSPAIDAGDPVDAPLTDYAGVTRPQGPQVDIGAYEYVVTTDVAAIENVESLVIVSPNPFQDRLSIAVQDGLQHPRFSVYTVQGNLAFSIAIPLSINEINTENLCAGVYFW